MPQCRDVEALFDGDDESVRWLQPLRSRIVCLKLAETVIVK